MRLTQTHKGKKNTTLYSMLYKYSSKCQVSTVISKYGRHRGWMLRSSLYLFSSMSFHHFLFVDRNICNRFHVLRCIHQTTSLFTTYVGYIHQNLRNCTLYQTCPRFYLPILLQRRTLILLTLMSMKS